MGLCFVLHAVQNINRSSSSLIVFIPVSLIKLEGRGAMYIHFSQMGLNLYDDILTNRENIDIIYPDNLFCYFKFDKIAK